MVTVPARCVETECQNAPFAGKLLKEEFYCIRIKLFADNFNKNVVYQVLVTLRSLKSRGKIEFDFIVKFEGFIFSRPASGPLDGSYALN